MSYDHRLVMTVVLNWNNASETLECLESLAKDKNSQHGIIVVDNGSNDDSVACIRQKYPEVILLQNSENLGYAEGNNTGIRYALEHGADFVFVLNNDARIAPDAIDHLVKAAEDNPRAGFLGPKIYHLHMPNVIQSTGSKLDFLWSTRHRGLDMIDQGQFEICEEVEFLSGSALFVRASTIKEIGLLDPDFFLYREDVDWCLRAREAGYSLLFVPKAKVWHRSHHVRTNDLPKVTYYLARNSLMLISKRKGGFLRLSLTLARQIQTLLSWSLRPKWNHKRQERDALIRGIQDYFHGKVGKGDI